MMALFGGLAVLRLKDRPEAERVLQVFVDIFFRSLDAGLREAGVGDLTVPKKMKAIAGAVYGRMGAYEGALATGDPKALEPVLIRNVFAGEESPFAAPLATYIAAVWVALQAAPTVQIEAASVWPPYPAAA
jgi:cytochrome b pre-mRNA-processing protein 3